MEQHNEPEARGDHEAEPTPCFRTRLSFLADIQSTCTELMATYEDLLEIVDENRDLLTQRHFDEDTVFYRATQEVQAAADAGYLLLQEIEDLIERGTSETQEAVRRVIRQFPIRRCIPFTDAARARVPWLQSIDSQIADTLREGCGKTEDLLEKMGTMFGYTRAQISAMPPCQRARASEWQDMLTARQSDISERFDGIDSIATRVRDEGTCAYVTHSLQILCELMPALEESGDTLVEMQIHLHDFITSDCADDQASFPREHHRITVFY